MFTKMPVLIDQPTAGVAVAQLLDSPSHQSMGVSVEQALRVLKRKLLREIRKHNITSVASWKDATLFQKSFSVQPAIFHKGRRYPAGAKVSLPVRYLELHDQRDQLYLMLPDFDDVLYVPERALLKTMLSETVRSETSILTPREIHRLWPAAKSEVRWLRLNLAEPKRHRLAQQTQTLSAVAEPLTDRRNLAIAPGSRDSVLEVLRGALSKGSCLLVGETGVGKSTLIATVAREMQLALRKQQKQSPESPRELVSVAPMFWQSSGGRLIAGMRYLGQWQQRLEAVVGELGDIDGVLVIENLLDLISVGGSEPRDSLAAFLLPYLRSGSLRMIAEATPTELDACGRLLPALLDALPTVTVRSLEPRHEIELLRITMSNRLQSTNIEFDPGIPACLSRLCRQFQSHAAPPGASMRFVEELTGRRRTDDVPQQWTIPWILSSFSRRTGLPLGLLDDAMLLRREDVTASLSQDVIGQDAACHEVASVVTRIKSAVQDPKKPFGCLLLCGPTGVGKTQLAKSLAKYLFGAQAEKLPLLRLDMSEFAGAAAGFRFLNNAEGNTAAWIQQIRSRPLSVLLLDEIEKASTEVFDILLSVLDEGRLTDRLGRVTSFRNAIILMTSNIGAQTSSSLGFSDDQTVDYASEVRKSFKPEFFNRLDRIIAFSPLSAEVIRKITEKELRDLQSREGLQRYQRKITWTDRLVDHLAKVGFESRLGARPLQQSLESEVVAPLSKWLVTRNFDADLELELDWNTDTQSLSIATPRQQG